MKVILHQDSDVAKSEYLEDVGKWFAIEFGSVAPGGDKVG